MSDNFLEKIRAVPSLGRAIIKSIVLFRAEKTVEITLITDMTFSEEDERAANAIARGYVPDYFGCGVKICKLTPDEDMIAKKIYSLLPEINRPLSAFISPADIRVERTVNGFYFTLEIIHASIYSDNLAEEISAALKKNFCGEFSGKCLTSPRKLEEIELEEEHENIRFEMPVRRFGIADFSFLEGSEEQKTAVYLSDLNFVSESVTVCGRIEDIRERPYTNSKGKEKLMFNFLLNDGTATVRIGYFSRLKSLEKIKKLKAGDFIVCTCKTENYHGSIRPTAVYVDYGRPPEGFVPEKRQSKPVPKYYETVFPQPFQDYTQGDLFTDEHIPDCLKDNVFVVFDLETTGLNSSPSGGNMDKIIEIGAYKISGGAINESFSTFVNPERRLSREISELTGIEQSMVENAPVYEKVMPDFYKFCDGAYLVGHNAANFDFKFIEYYSSLCGYIPERRIFDTIPLSQQLVPNLSNYKLNTVAEHFGITFNHHRAADDALATAKIFIELIKIKKVLPNLF